MATGLPHRKRRQVMTSVAALAAIAVSFGLYVIQSPPEYPVRRAVVRSARAVGRLIGVGGDARRPIGDLIRRAEQGDDNARAVAVLELRYEVTDSARFAQVTPVLLRSLRDESRSVQDAAMSVLGDLILRYGRDDTSGRAPGTSLELEQGMVQLMEASRTELRVFAINQLGPLARMRGLKESPARLVACLDDDSEPVRAAAAWALVSYARGPERLLPVALRRLPGEGPLAAKALTHIFWSFRFPPSCVPMLTAALASDRWVVRVSAICALNHMGLDATPARDEVMALLRRELGHPRPAFEVRLVDRADPAQVPESGPNRVILGRDAQGRLHLRVFGPGGERLVDTDENRLADRVDVVAALKRDLAGFSPARPPGQDEQGRLIVHVEALIGRPLEGPSGVPAPVDVVEQACEALVQLSPDGELLPGTVEILCEVLRRPYPFRQQAAAWSLGYLGPAASRAVTRLQATLDTAPKTERELRERTVFALVAIVRGTPDEDRVIARLVEARRSAEDRDKTLLTRALLRLTPKAEQLVPELRGLRDDTPSPIEIGRLPRSFREAGSPSGEL
jgi:hypothetical protein